MINLIKRLIAYARFVLFCDERGVHMFALDGGETRLGEFVCNLVAAGDSQVVDGFDVFFSGHADSKEFAGLDVVHGLVSLVDADGHLVEIVDTSPGGHHGVGGLVFVVGPDDQNGLGVKQCFLSEILAHSNSMFWVLT